MALIKDKFEFRVRYCDTDKMGIVYNGNYLSYFEIGRTELLRNIGMSYHYIEEMGYYLPLLGANLEFIKSAKYDDIIRIETEIESELKVRFTFNYKIYRNNELLTIGSTTHCFMDIPTMKPARPPKFFIEFVQNHINSL